MKLELHQYIMIVDDEASLVDMLQDVMALAGFPCRGYTQPQKALAAFVAEPQAYKVVITDLTMPVMRGDDFAFAIQQISPDCKIILSTGYQTENLNSKLKNFTLLQKPYQIENLLNLIRQF